MAEPTLLESLRAATERELYGDQQAIPRAPSDVGIVAPSLRRGVASATGMAADYGRSLAEAAGADSAAAGLRATADQQMLRAQRQRGTAPATLDEIDDLSGAAQYALSRGIESVPVSLAAGAGYLLGGKRGAVGAVLPVTAGEISYDMRNDPDSTATPGQQALAATGGGLVNAALESIPEAGILARMQRGLREFGPSAAMRELAKSTLSESATEVGQTGVSRGTQSIFNPDISIDPRDPKARSEYLESAAAGAAGGVVIGAPGAAARAFDPMRSRLERAALPPPAEAGTEAPDTQRSSWAQSTNEWLQQRQDLTPERRDELNAAAWSGDADTIRRAQDQADIDDTIAGEFTRLAPTDGKASLRQTDAPAVPEAVTRALADADLPIDLESPRMRSYVALLNDRASGGRLDDNLLDGARDVFGERAYSVLRALPLDEAAVQQVDRHQRRQGDIRNFLREHLRPEYKSQADDRLMRQLRTFVGSAISSTDDTVFARLGEIFTDVPAVLDAFDATGEFSRGTAVAEQSERVATTEDEANPALNDKPVEFMDATGVNRVRRDYYGTTTQRRLRKGTTRRQVERGATPIREIPAPGKRAALEAGVRIALGEATEADFPDIDPAQLRRSTAAAAKAIRDNPESDLRVVGGSEVARLETLDPQEFAADDAFLVATREEAVDDTSDFQQAAVTYPRGKSPKAVAAQLAEMRANRRDKFRFSYVEGTAPDGSPVIIDLGRLTMLGRKRQAGAPLTLPNIRDAVAEGYGALTQAGYTINTPADDVVIHPRSDGWNTTWGDIQRIDGIEGAGSAASVSLFDREGAIAATLSDFDVTPVWNDRLNSNMLELTPDVAKAVLDAYALAEVATPLAQGRTLRVTPEVAALLREQAGENLRVGASPDSDDMVAVKATGELNPAAADLRRLGRIGDGQSAAFNLAKQYRYATGEMHPLAVMAGKRATASEATAPEIKARWEQELDTLQKDSERAERWRMSERTAELVSSEPTGQPEDMAVQTAEALGIPASEIERSTERVQQQTPEQVETAARIRAERPRARRVDTSAVEAQDAAGLRQKRANERAAAARAALQKARQREAAAAAAAAFVGPLRPLPAYIAPALPVVDQIKQQARRLAVQRGALGSVVMRAAAGGERSLTIAAAMDLPTGPLATKINQLRVAYNRAGIVQRAARRGVEPSANALALAQTYVKNWDTLTTRTQQARAHRMETLLGPNLDAPVDFVLVTPGVGDAGFAARVARDLGIDVLDVTTAADQRTAGDVARAILRPTPAQKRAPEPSQRPTAPVPDITPEEKARSRFMAGVIRHIDATMGDTGAYARLDALYTMAKDAEFFQVFLEGKDVIAAMNQHDWLAGKWSEYLASEDKASLRETQAQRATDAEIDSVIEYIERVLPADVLWNITNSREYSGLFRSRTVKRDGVKTVLRTIELSAYAADIKSTGFHESLHALLRVMASDQQHRVTRILAKAADSRAVRGQLEVLLRNDPAALEQLHDPEERMAYMFEFWAGGALNLGPQTSNVFHQLVNLIRKVLGLIGPERQAELVMRAFHDGRLRDHSSAALALAQTEGSIQRLARTFGEVVPKVTQLFERLFSTSHERLKESGNPALSQIADLFYAEGTSTSTPPGYIQATRQATNMFGSQFANIVRGLTDPELAQLSAALRAGTKPTDPAVNTAYQDIKRMLRRLYNYSEQAGVGIRRVDDYYPQWWNADAVRGNVGALAQLLRDHAEHYDAENRVWVPFEPMQAQASAEALALPTREGIDQRDDLVGFSPYMQAADERMIRLKDRAQFAQFMEPDVVRVMTRYITQSVKRAEYTRRFGEGGKGLQAMLDEARDLGMTDVQEHAMVTPAIKALDGTLGSDISPQTRAAMSGMMVMQNFAILPLSLFSSLVDAMGIAVRSGDMRDAWRAFGAGIRQIPNSIRRNGYKTDMQVLAEDIGTVEESFVLDMLGDMYGSVYLSDWARKANNALFKYNLMEGWNTAMRSSATQVATQFIVDHAKNPGKHSKRFLEELNLKPEDVFTGPEGELLYRAADLQAVFQQQGIQRDPVEASRKVRDGVLRWVDSAVLRPHAAHRPAWASDPHWMLVWHMKQFTYSFHKTILDRVATELDNGNFAPLLPLMAYVPFMIAADFARAGLQGLGDEPEWRQGMGPADYILQGVERSGLMGIRQLGADFAESPVFALGPTANWAWESTAKTLDGNLESAIVSSLPGHALWREW